jgi:hypothetical protein
VIRRIVGIGLEIPTAVTAAASLVTYSESAIVQRNVGD